MRKMSRVPASVVDSCAPLNKSLLESTDSTACCPCNLIDCTLPLGSAALAHDAQELLEHLPSATKKSRVVPTPVEDAFETRHSAVREARVAELKTYLDKIEEESYRSIKRLKSSLQEVDRMIHLSSPHALSPFTPATRRQDTVCQCQSTARRFFYNRGQNSCSSPPLPSSYGSAVSDPQVIQSDGSSVSSTSVGTTSFLLNFSAYDKQLNSNRSICVSASNSAHSVPLQHMSSSIPRKLDTVFGGFSSIKHNSRKLCTRLHHAKKIMARASLEAHASPDSSRGKDAESVEVRKPFSLELLDDIEYSVKTAERLNMQVEHLEQKSRRRLNEVYDEMLVRQKFKLSPWQRRVKRPSPVLLRAFSGLKHVTNAQCDTLTSVGEISASGSHKPFTYASGRGRANWSYGLFTVNEGGGIPNKQREVSNGSFLLYNGGSNSAHCYPPDTAKLQSALDTTHHNEIKSTKLSDVEISLQSETEEKRRHAGYGGENASQSQYCSSIPDRSHAAGKTLSGASIFTSSCSQNDGAVGSSLQRRSRRLITGQTPPQPSQHLNRQRPSSSAGSDTFGSVSVLRDATEALCSDPLSGSDVSGTTASRTADGGRWHSRLRVPQNHPPLVHVRDDANESQWRSEKSSWQCSDSAVYTLPQSALCHGSEGRSQVLGRVPLNGCSIRDSWQSTLDQHNVVGQFPYPELHEAGNRALPIASQSYVFSPFSFDAVVKDESGHRQRCARDITPPQYSSNAPPVQCLRGTEDKATNSYSQFGLDFPRHLYAPCDLSLKVPPQGDGLSQSALTSVSCRLLPSPSPSVKHPSAHN